MLRRRQSEPDHQRASRRRPLRERRSAVAALAWLLAACGGAVAQRGPDAPVVADRGDSPPAGGSADGAPAVDGDALDSIDGAPARAPPRPALPQLDAERAARCLAWTPIAAAAERASGLPSGLLLAIAWVESGFEPAARSSAGARGPMQMLPATAEAFGCREPHEPACAMAAAAAFLASTARRFRGDWVLALAGYNAGPARVARAIAAGQPTPSLWYAERVLAAQARLERDGCQAEGPR